MNLSNAELSSLVKRYEVEKRTQYNVREKALLVHFCSWIQEQNFCKPDVLSSADVHKLGEAILKKQFEIYSPLRKAVVEVPEIVYQFDKAGIDIVPKVDF